MNNKEQFENLKTCHMFLAIQRKKDGHSSKKVHRRIIYDEEKDFQIIKASCDIEGGLWRIYHTVNARDMVKALANFRHILLDATKTSVASMWRKELLQQYNRAERKFMIDLDDLTKKEQILDFLETEGKQVLEEHKSPNGLHLICEPFNRKNFSDNFPGVDVLVDGYYFVGFNREEQVIDKTHNEPLRYAVSDNYIKIGAFYENYNKWKK